MAITENRRIMEVAERANTVAPVLKRRVVGALNAEMGMHFDASHLPDVEFMTTEANQRTGSSLKGVEGMWGGVPVFLLTKVLIDPVRIGVEADSQVENSPSMEEAALELMIGGILAEMSGVDVGAIAKRALARKEY